MSKNGFLYMTNCINENNETIDTSTNHNSVLDDMIFVQLRNKAIYEHIHHMYMNIIDDIPIGINKSVNENSTDDNIFYVEAEGKKGLTKSLLIKNTETSSEVDFLRNEKNTFYLEQ